MVGQRSSSPGDHPNRARSERKPRTPTSSHVRRRSRHPGRGRPRRPGRISFRREKFVPRGGPDGGDGGHGGSVYLVASPHINTLVNYRFHPEFHAERGEHGEGSNRTGQTGADLELPCRSARSSTSTIRGRLAARPLADLDGGGARVLVAQGGRGGRGNAHFATSTNRAPRRVEPGLPGEAEAAPAAAQAARRRRAGRLSERRQIHADRAHLGGAAEDRRLSVHDADAESRRGAARATTAASSVADVPGLIEGAHRGHGLGHRFLRHLERTKVLVHVVDVSATSGRRPVEDFDVIRRELELFDPSSPPSRSSSRPTRWTRDRRATQSARSRRAPRAGIAALPHLRRHRRRRARAARSKRWRHVREVA